MKKGNSKIRNATITRKHGRTFRSNLELHMYERLRLHNIKFEFQKRFKVLDKFKYRGETVKSMSVTPDFWFRQYNIIADPKGYSNDTWPMREKLLKRALLSQGLEPEIRILKNKKAVDNFILELLSKKSRND